MRNGFNSNANLDNVNVFPDSLSIYKLSHLHWYNDS